MYMNVCAYVYESGVDRDIGEREERESEREREHKSAQLPGLHY